MHHIAVPQSRTHMQKSQVPAFINIASYDVAFAPDGKTIASVSSDNPVRLWSVEMSSFLLIKSG
jgi:WD40 repeat protein